MLIYLMRHARTAYSANYRVNGRPEVGVPIDHVGYEQCRAARARHRLEAIASCVVLLASSIMPRYVERRLGEIDYGVFEGRGFLEYGRWLDEHGPWRRPPGSPESQREAILRMLAGLGDVLRWPGPRLVVAHGLLVSVIRQRSIEGIYFPEAPYMTPIQLSDDELRSLVARLTDEIDSEWGSGISADADRRTC